jgi:MYXO-CTERM domain-containing protein
MEFTVLGDYWSVQINPFAGHEQEQQAIDAIANGTAPVAGIITPEPAAALPLLSLAAAAFLRRRRH